MAYRDKVRVSGSTGEARTYIFDIGLVGVLYRDSLRCWKLALNELRALPGGLSASALPVTQFESEINFTNDEKDQGLLSRKLF